MGPAGSRCSALSTLTHTAHSSGVELKVRGAVTQVSARGVHTQAVDAVHRVRTLVDVWNTHTHTKLIGYTWVARFGVDTLGLPGLV